MGWGEIKCSRSFFASLFERVVVGPAFVRTFRAEPKTARHGSCAWVGMTDHDTFEKRKLPQHKLVAYQVAIAFLAAVRDARIRDPKLNDQALRAAKSVCLNLAEGAGRVSRGDKKRAYAIARGEAVEAMASVEIAAVAGDTSTDAAARCNGIGDRLYALLTGLVR